ncbi:MAG: hypothetical protein AB1445_09970 [Bacillota bacterium]
MARRHNPRYDLALRALLCGTSSGRPTTRARVEQLVGDSDLDGFLAYTRSCVLSRYFTVVEDGHYLTLSLASRELLQEDSPVSGEMLAVFLFIWKWHQDNAMPVAQGTVVEHFVGASRSASRSVRRAIDQLAALKWIDEVTGTQGRTWVPTRSGTGAMGQRFLALVVESSQGRPFSTREVLDFFGVSTPSGSTHVPPLTLFDTPAGHARYDRALRRIIVGTATGRPPTLAAVARITGDPDTTGLAQYAATLGLDRFFRLAVHDRYLLALVEASELYSQNVAPVRATALTLAAYTWYLEEFHGRPVRYDQVEPLFVDRVAKPLRQVALAVGVLARRGWVKQPRGRKVFSLTPTGRECLGRALGLRPQDDHREALREFAEIHFAGFCVHEEDGHS